MSGMDRIDVELDRREADELAELEELREREAPAGAQNEGNDL